MRVIIVRVVIYGLGISLLFNTLGPEIWHALFLWLKVVLVLAGFIGLCLIEEAARAILLEKKPE